MEPAGAVEDFEVGDGVLVDDDEVGEFAGAHDADVVAAEGLGAPHGGGADHFERMEAGLLQQLELADVVEAVELEDESGVAAGGDVAPSVFVIVDELHPEAVVLLPLDLVGGGPVEPVRAVRLAARLVELPERREGVLVVPLGAHRAHQVAARLVDRERRIDVEVQLHQLVDRGVPLLGAGRRGLLPEAAGLAEAILFVVVVVARRVVLDGPVGEHRLRQSVPVLHPF